MLPFFWYMLKVMICSGILLGYYWLFLRNKIFHGYNRFYLLSAMVLSLMLPLFKISFWQQDASQNQVVRVLQAVSAGDDYMNSIVVSARSSNWTMQDFYLALYWSVCAGFLFVMMRTLYLITRLLRKFPVQMVDDVSFVNTDDNSTPFSFLRFIFWNSNIDIDTNTGRQIFKHEVAHIQEKHTYDKLFVNTVLVFCWCNPFFWIYRRELNMIHEFIADKKAVEDNDTADFAAMILQAAYPQHRFELANNFFYSPIKRRLLMLSKNKNPKVNYLGRVMVLPLAVLVFAAFTFKTKQPVPANLQGSPTGLSKLDTFPARKNGMFVNVKNADSAYLRSNDFMSKALVIVDSKEVGNLGNNYVEKSAEKFSSISICGPAEAVKTYGDKGRFGAIKLTQKDAVFITANAVTYDEKTKSINLTGPDTKLRGDLESTLIYVDGKLITPDELNKIPPADIEAINILKGEKLDDIAEAKGKTAIINVSLKPSALAEVVVEGHASSPYKEVPVAIALDKMNVLYIGVDNPLTIAVPNIPSDQLIVMIDNGSISGSNGRYIAHVTQSGTATIRVATVQNDRKVMLSEQVFRVKFMPDPVNGKIPTDFDAKYQMDSTSYLKMEQDYKQLKEKQLLVAYDLKERLVAGQQIQEQKLRADKDLLAKTVAGRKIQETEFQNQKLALEKAQQYKLQLMKGENEALLAEQKDLLAIQQTTPVFTKVEVEPSFPGGINAWREYLRRNLNAAVPVDEGWKAGKYTVIVKFIVHTDGKISDVTTENYKGSKTAKHCIEVIQKGPNWLPAVQNGKKVNAYRKQPINFVISEN